MGQPRKLLQRVGDCVCIVIASFLIWKYALDEPQTWNQTKEGFGELFEAAGDKWDQWDLGNFSNVLDNLDDFSFADLFDEDPKHRQQGDNSTRSWKSGFIQPNNGGLHLTLQNALDDTWQNEFAAAVKDWQESDALELSTEKVAVDHACNRVYGVMVVCNGNFGASGWVGINENSVNYRGVIVSSVAKMNEYYLRNANFDLRRFTMCHELGHGESRVCISSDKVLSLCFDPLYSHESLLFGTFHRIRPSTHR